MIKCKCGGVLKVEEHPKSIENPEEYVLGRCADCGRPWTFSVPMWKELKGEGNES